MRSLFVTIVASVVCAAVISHAAAHLEVSKVPQLFCGSSKSASGTNLDGDDITYFATINNISGPFAVHLYMKRVDCSPSCDPSVFSIFAADGKVNRRACRCFDHNVSCLRLQGSHQEHQYQLREGQTITMDVTPKAGETQFDWMWQAVAICDYGLLFNYSVVCK
jgi:hypothetical protein